jgi:stress response protein YsnF
MNSDEQNRDTLERHYRVTLDFRMLVRDITPEVCQESLSFNDQCNSASEPSFQEFIERQRRLYQLLRNNPSLLDQYLLTVLTQEAGNCVYESLPDAFDAREEEEILIPLYKSMAEEDVRYFDECREMKVLDENLELIYAAVKVEWVGAELQEINRTLTGDVQRAKIIEKTRLRFMKRLIAPR